MGSSHGGMARPAVSEPTAVQHTAHLHLSPEGVATLQVPELESFLDQEGISFSERATWDVLRFVYQLGGLPLVRETLHMIRERRARAGAEGPSEEPAPDYDVPYEVRPASSPGHRRRSDQQRRSISSSSSRSSSEEEPAEIRKPGREAIPLPTSPTFLQHAVRETRDHDREIEDGWTSARSSMDPSSPHVSDLPHGRPVSRMWKRPMAPEVHQDLVRALRERSRESLDHGTVGEQPEDSQTEERPGSLPALADM